MFSVARSSPVACTHAKTSSGLGRIDKSGPRGVRGSFRQWMIRTWPPVRTTRDACRKSVSGSSQCKILKSSTASTRPSDSPKPFSITSHSPRTMFFTPKAVARSLVRATMRGSMSNARSSPEIRWAIGMLKVPKPHPSSATSRRRLSMPNSSRIRGTSNSVSQYSSSGIPLSRSFMALNPDSLAAHSQLNDTRTNSIQELYC